MRTPANSFLTNCRIPVAALCLSFIAHSPSLALDPSRVLTQYVQTIWRMEEGLPHNTVRATLQARDGYLWLGTYGGLVRFDGVRFRVFDNRNSGLRDNEIRALAEDHDGVLWVGTTAGGLHRLRGDRLEPFDEGIKHQTINALQVTPDGALWIGTSGGLYRLQRGVKTHIAEAEGLDNPFVASLAMGDNESWVGTSSGLFRWAGGRAERYDVPGFDAPNLRALFKDRSGRLWVGVDQKVLEIRPDPSGHRVSVIRSSVDRHLRRGFVSAGGRTPRAFLNRPGVSRSPSLGHD